MGSRAEAMMVQATVKVWLLFAFFLSYFRASGVDMSVI